MNIPALGPRGEGWVGLQFVFLGLVAAGALLAPGTSFAGDPGIVPVIGSLLLLAGAALAGWGILALQGGNALTPLPYPRETSALVESGAYRLVRHPVYGGLILVAAGWATLAASLPALVAAAALAVTLDLKRRREEVWLTDRYPGYPAYCERTRALIPFVY